MATGRSIMKKDSGFKLDCERLLQKFSSRGTLLYRNFVEEWQNMKFALIFRGRCSIYDMITFIEEAVVIAKSYLSVDNNISKRVGGLYLLYGLYYRQPTVSENDKYVKIRIDYNEWIMLLELVNSLKHSRLYDACYIFYKMVLEGAFHFVCFTHVYGIEQKRRKRRKEFEKNDSEESTKDEKLMVSSSILEKLLGESNFTIPWRKKEMEYNRLKKDLGEQNIVDSDKMKSTDFIEDILKDLNTTYISPPKSDVGERRRALKNQTQEETSAKSELMRRPGTLASIRDEMFKKIMEDIDNAGRVNDQEKDSGTNKDDKKTNYKKFITYVEDIENEVENPENEDKNDYTKRKKGKSLPNIITSPSFNNVFDDEECDSDSGSDDDSSDSDSSDSNSSISDVNTDSREGTSAIKKQSRRIKLPKHLTTKSSLEGLDFLLFS